MEIIKNTNGKELTVALVGRLDTTTAPELEKSINSDLEAIESLVFDFEKLEYVSSAGLRVLLACQKAMNAKGSMVVTKANSEIMEVFEITGFTDILTIK